MSVDVLNFITDASSSVRMRWREPYVTEGLNKKNFAVQAPGIYRGFVVAPDNLLGDRTVSIFNSEATDHLAVVQQFDGYSISILRDTGSFLIDLSAYPVGTVVIAIYAVYTVGTDTVAFLRTYTQAQYDAAPEKPDLVVLGSVDVPLAGPISSSMLHADLRTSAWQNVSAEAHPAKSLVRNGSFEDYAVAGNVTSAVFRQPFRSWVATSSSATYAITRVAAGLRTGLSSCQVAPTGAIVGQSATVTQYFFTPVDISTFAGQWGQRVKGRLFYTIAQAAIAGTMTVELIYSGAGGGVPTNVALCLSVSLVAPVGITELPLAFDLARLTPAARSKIHGIQISFTGVQYAGVGSGVQIEDVELFLSQETGMARGELPMVAQEFPAGIQISNTFLGDIDYGSLATTPAEISRTPSSPQDGNIDLRLASKEDGHTAITNVLRWNFQGVVKLGSKVALGADADIQVPLLQIPMAAGPTKLVLVSETIGATLVREYVSGGGERYITSNASWNGATALWTQDDGAKPSFMQALSSWRAVKGQFPGFLYKQAAAAPWVDSAWLAKLNVNTLDNLATIVANTNVIWAENGILYFPSPDTGTNNGDSNLDKGIAPLPNALYAKNIVKAWMDVSTDGLGGHLVLNSFGFTSTVTLTADHISINLSNAMSSFGFTVNLTGYSGGTNDMQVWGIVGVGLGNIQIRGFRLTDAGDLIALINPQTEAVEVNILVCGPQT